jgi:D-alanyl-D-alanine carboxypeptidase
MCAESALVLYESNPHTRHYPASLVKVMTALIVLENTDDLEETVYFSERAVTLPWYAASMGMRAGDTLTVWEALHGILLPSANEVANALAEHVAGSIGDFVKMMNARALELGAENTVFVNACGLPGDGQHTTAYDMSLIMRRAVTHPAFVQIINTASFAFPPTQRHPEGRTLRNTNRLVRSDDDFYSEWVVGGKTGWITAARNTLTTYSVQNDRGIIVTVLYTDGAPATFADTITLLSHGFSLLAAVPLPVIVPEGEEYEYIPGEHSGVITLPGAGKPGEAETKADDLTETEKVTPASPWERMASFTIFLAQILAVITAVSGVGALILLVRKRKTKEKGKWTSYSKTSPQ